MMINKIPQEVKDIANILLANNYQAYLVGGSVRDLLHSSSPDDYDIATDATPEKGMLLFAKTVPTGIKHGTFTIVMPNGQYEVTTFRIDGKYEDFRHPEEVTFAKTIHEDLSRRDFTFNAISFNFSTDLIEDPFNGKEDYKNKLVKTVGNPYDRFNEDALRMLRAIRFASRFGFTIEPKTFEAIKALSKNLEFISKERIRDELMKILSSPKPSYGIELMRETNLLELVIPELLDGYGFSQNEYHAYDVYTHNIYAADFATKPLIRLAALLHDVGKPKSCYIKKGRKTFHNHEMDSVLLTQDIMLRLKFSNEEINYVTHLIGQHMFGYSSKWTDGAVRRLMRSVGLDQIDDLMELRHADRMAKRPNMKPESKVLEELKTRMRNEIEKASAFSLKDLDIDGNIIMTELNLKPGPQVGKVLNYLLEQVLENPELNTKEQLIKLAKEKCTYA